MEIISRARWGAQYARGFGDAPLPASELWLHHTVTAGGGVLATFETDAAAIRLLEQIGQNRFGGGISYSLLVTESGRVWDGHGIDRRGAHTAGRNSVSRSIALVGDYSRREPTGPQLAATAELVAYGHRMGWWAAPRLSGGHRDAPGAATACPGDLAQVLIPAINTAASARPPIPQEDDLTPEQDRMLRQIHRETTAVLPNRRGPQGEEIPGGGADTLFGYAMNADGLGYRASWTLHDVVGRLEELAAMTTGLAERIAAAEAPAPPEIDYTRLAAALLQAVGR